MIPAHDDDTAGTPWHNLAAPQQRVERILKDAVEEAYGRTPAVTPEIILGICGCSHETGAHHGPQGLGRCGETGCDCLGWHPCQIECPDCDGLWDELAAKCKHCGLTIEDIAERHSR